MNKLIKSAMMMASVGAMLCIVGCGEGAASAKDAKPEDVATAVVKALVSGKADEAYLKSVCTERSAASMLMVKDMLVTACRGATFEVVDTKVSGDTAVVKMKQHGGAEGDGKIESFNLKQVDGQWRFDNF